jgi:F0F1-type ATP synthase epsilon subunit
VMMSHNITVSVLVPASPVFVTTAHSVTFTSSSGPLTIMYNHARYACPVHHGPLAINGTVVALIEGIAGFAYVYKNHTTLVLRKMPDIDRYSF